MASVWAIINQYVYRRLPTKHPAKLARKLRERRLAKEKGILQKAKKKSKPLAGANQFHKKGRKKKR